MKLRHRLSLKLLLLLGGCLIARAEGIPTLHGLTVNMLCNTGQVFLNGYPVPTPLEEAIVHQENYQFIEISTQNPTFGWMIATSKNNTEQSAYRLLIASDKRLLIRDSADLWDTEKVNSSQSINIPYGGRQLETGKVYFWKVKIWDNHGNESTFSEISRFKTSDSFLDYSTDRYPLQKEDDYPIVMKRVNDKTYLADFGKASFGRLRVNLYSCTGTDTVIIHLGEAFKEGRVDRSPSGSIRYSRYSVMPKKGWNTYVIAIRPDKRNTGPQAVLMPRYIGEVTPFRYCEIENYTHPLQEKDLVRETVFYPFSEKKSCFHSSDTVLNQVWDISEYSIKATSFLGVYIDGDRERIPYEADALINQLSHYSMARDYSMARYTHEYLIHHPTWPTEWILQSVLMAWEDYMYTGNTLSLEHFYDDLKAKSLTALADQDGFISTRTGKVTPEVLQSIHFDGQLRDIVDWPHTGILGLEKEKGGETDGFVFTDINTVVNAYHYRALTLMARIAKVLGKENDQSYYIEKANRLKQLFNTHLFDKKRSIYVDGIGTNHASLHANMFPLAFGLVPEKRVDKILEFIRSRGMACSVYGSQFLLDALYDAHDAEYGLQLLTSTDERSWYNMIRAGSTITMEAWDNKYKPNQDWNHAWGAAPANLIPRKLMGIEPLEPGFQKIRIKPQPGSLESAEIKHPTIKGNVFVSFINRSGESFRLEVDIPANTTAEIQLPFLSKQMTVLMDDRPVPYRQENGFSVIETVGSGRYTFTVKR
ncbi:family 78 glycoside hydrolase catalytic domain [Proteiniphilum sp. UBA5384]|uniref:family 78 glycoside hydrolase catalytic domain n=1 Tax=Proteiniphilum sp. UBA5384 TaxID=1947279 RepID=UPI0025FD5DB4|nr:family 78 glycoside hydrolase catalytic domain [Proteiniphilum sp. UBA5384]